MTSRTYYLKITLLVLHFLLFDLWWLVGPLGPIQGWRSYWLAAEQTKKQGSIPCERCGRPARATTYYIHSSNLGEPEKAVTRNYCPAHTDDNHPEDSALDRVLDMSGFLLFGTLAFVLALWAPASALKAHRRDVSTIGEDKKERKVVLGFSFASIMGGVFFFCMSTLKCYLYYPALAAGESGGLFRSGPLVERYLTFPEITVVAITVGFLVFYSSFYLRPTGLLVTSPHWTVTRTIVTNFFTFLVYLVAVVGICLVAAIVAQIVSRLLLMFLEFMATNMSSEVQSETGPGLSRSVPYGFELAAGGIGTLMLGIYLLLVLPYKLSSKVLDWLLRWSTTSEDAMM